MKARYSFIAAVILAAVLIGQPVPAQAGESPRLAGGNRIVDDDRQQCPTAGYTSIGAALADATAGSTVTVCAGTYTEQLLVDSKPGLKLVGKDMPRIVAPSNTHGAVIEIRNSSNVTVQGFHVDGNFVFPTVASWWAGIAFNNSSGTISENFISHMRQRALYVSTQGVGIEVFGSTATKPLAVKILSNTITDFQHAGVSVTGNYMPTISRNLIQMHSNGQNAPTGIMMYSLPGGSISGNAIMHNYGLGIDNYSYGIYGIDTSNVKIASNTITGSREGITLRGSVGAAGSNTISGNKVIDAGYGISVYSIGGTAHDNAIVKNTIIGFYRQDARVGVSVDGGTETQGTRVIGNTIQGYDIDSIHDDGTGTAIQNNKISPFALPGM
jgi:parallel beta-helix repeat protein